MLGRLLRVESLAALVLTGIGVFVVATSWSSASGVFVKAGGITAWTLPGIYGAILVGLALLLLTKALLRHGGDAGRTLDRRGWLRVVGTLIAAVAYGMALTEVPFFLSTAVLLAALFVLYGRRQVVPIVVTALVGAGVLDVLFIRLLNLPI